MEEAILRDKAAVMDALAAAGITSVVVPLMAIPIADRSILLWHAQVNSRSICQPLRY